MSKDRKRKIVYVGFAFSHHKNTYAGYNRIQEYLDYDYVINIQRYFEATSFRLGLLNRIIGVWHTILHKCLEINCLPICVLKLVWLAIFRGNLIIHFVHGENFFPVKLLNHIHRNNHFVFTFHQPFAWFEQNQFFENRKQLCDGIILMSNNEISKYRNATGCENIVCIPHGIATDFFDFEENRNRSHMILTVGSWLRDFAFAKEVYDHILKVDPTINIVIVSNEESSIYFNDDTRISFYHGISNEQLRELYHQCSVLFLPLIRFTANNSLLEAASCGCNIVISSDYGSDNTYIPSDMLKVVPMDCNIATRTILDTLADSRSNKALANYIRQKYSWEIIANDTKRFLFSIN